VRVWRRGQAEAALTLRGHELSVMAVAVAEDGQQALSGSRDCSLRHWDLATGATKGRCHLEQNVVTCLKWVPGETSLVAQGSEDLRLRLWDVRTLSRPAAVLENEYVYFPLCCDCSGPYVLTGSNGFNSVGCELRLWDRRTLKQVHVLTGHDQAVTGCALLPDTALRPETGGGGRLLAASGCKDGEVRLWDGTAGGASTALFKLHDGDQVTGLAAGAPADERARLYVSAASGAIYALGIDDDATALTAVAIGSGGTVGDALAIGGGGTVGDARANG